MNAKTDEFILNVRDAARLGRKFPVLMSPLGEAFDPTAEQLKRAMGWLTPKAVNAYEPSEFSSLDGGLQERLRKAVESFKTAATAVTPEKLPSRTQLYDGKTALNELTSTVQNIVRKLWEDAANELLSRVETWLRELSWEARREKKNLTELLIGDYTLDQLFFHTGKNLYIFDPLARFIPGGTGAFDLSIQPSFYTTSIYRRTDGNWFVQLGFKDGSHLAKSEPLTKATFEEAVLELRSLL